MERQVRRYAVAAVTVMVGGTGLVGCSSNDSPSPSASSAISALQSGASSLGSSAASAAASAAESAASALETVQDGLDAKADVTLGAVTTGSDGRTNVPVTVTNHGSQSARYTVEVSFKDQAGNLLDVTVVSVPELAAGGTTQTGAQSNRDLAGPVNAEVGAALRY